MREADRRELLEQALRVVAALDGADAFPQDRDGLEELLGRLATGRPSEPREILYEDPEALPRYTGDLTTWVSPAGDGALRVRRASWGRELSSDVVVLHPDGRTDEFEVIEGFGVPATELTEQARADLAAHEARIREQEESRPAEEEELERRQTLFQTANLVRAVAGPPGRDPAGPMIAYVVLYSTGFTLDYFVPRPDRTEASPDDPWAEPLFQAMFPRVEIDDGLGTTYEVADLDHVDANSTPLRARLAFTPPIPDAAMFLRVVIDGTAIGLDLGAP